MALVEFRGVVAVLRELIPLLTDIRDLLLEHRPKVEAPVKIQPVQVTRYNAVRANVRRELEKKFKVDGLTPAEAKVRADAFIKSVIKKAAQQQKQASGG